MLYGDLGRVPLSIGIKKRAVGFWYDMILNKDKLSSIIFQISLHDAVHNNHIYNWLHFVQSIFDECGLSYIWQGQSVNGSKSVLLSRLDVILKSQFIQKWQSDINMSTKCAN